MASHTRNAARRTFQERPQKARLPCRTGRVAPAPGPTPATTLRQSGAQPRVYVEVQDANGFAPSSTGAGLEDRPLDDSTASAQPEGVDDGGDDEYGPVSADQPSEFGERVDFASRKAARDKMQIWLTAFTALAALAVLIVVSMSLKHAG
jgi:hypothetical protein